MIKWLYNHYALTGSICLYFMVLIGYGTIQVFADVSSITGAAATAYGVLMGLPAAVIGLIKWRIERDKVPDEQA